MLMQAVRSQMVSDVPIGATVSGGLDSSTVALLADRLREQSGAAGKLHLFNGLTPEMRSIRIVKDPSCRGCS